MALCTGYMGKSYDIDLSTGEIKILDISQHVDLYLGGKGVGTRLLYDNTPPGMDPYDDRMPLIFSTGPLTGNSAPQSNRFVVTTKSPLTGAVANSTCGGDFARQLKRAGVDVVMVRGKAKAPVYIEITDEGGASIKDATRLWGKGAVETQELLPKGFGKAVIGPAGENRVRFACIVSQERVAGRTGCGAVMGAKNLKAIIADGKMKIVAEDKDAFEELRKSMVKYLKSHPMTGKILPDLGTANIVNTAAGRNILPVNNFQRGTDHRAPRISGEALAAKHLKRRVGCVNCPIVCGRGIDLHGKRTKGPEYETLSIMGSNLGNFNLPDIFEWNYLCDDLGMDTISTGGVLGFATELTERGMLKSNLSFDSHEAVAGLLHDIAHRNGLGDDLAEGVKRMSEKYGGHDFAIHVKGLELPGYDPRGCYGQGLEYATTNRGGCHVQGATMFLEATGPISIDPLSVKSKAGLVILQQNLSAAICSSVFCMFSSYAMLPRQVFGLDPQGMSYKAVTQVLLNSGPILELVLKAKAPLSMLWFEKFLTYVMGKKVSLGDYTELGERVFNLERIYNIREGFTSRDDTLPPRILNESTFKGVSGGVPLHEMLPKYYRIRGWDKYGIPRDQTLDRLGITT